MLERRKIIKKAPQSIEMDKVTLFFMIVIFMKRVNSLTNECSLWIMGKTGA